MADAMQTCQLLNLPNETLLTIAAYVPYSGGESIITLRLVNRQLRDLLTDNDNLRQLRKYIARVQFSTAQSLHTAYNKNNILGWENLRQLEQDTSWVRQVHQSIQAAQMESQSSSDKKSLPSPLNPSGSLQNTQANNESELLFWGLHLFGALSRSRINIRDEKASAHWALALGVPMLALLRFTAVRLVFLLRHLYGKFEPEVNDWAHSALFGTEAAFAMVDLVIETGFSIISLVCAPDENTPSPLYKVAHVFDFLAPKSSTSELQRLINFFPGYFGKGMPYFWVHYEYLRCKSTGYIAPASHHHGMTQNWWGNVANNLLVADVWAQVIPDWKWGAESECVPVLFKFCYSKQLSDQVDWEKTFSASEVSTMINHLFPYDWYGFVDDNLGQCMSRAADAWSANGGLSTAVVGAFQRAVAQSGQDYCQEAGVPSNPPQHFTYLCLRDYWKANKV